MDLDNANLQTNGTLRLNKKVLNDIDLFSEILSLFSDKNSYRKNEFNGNYTITQVSKSELSDDNEFDIYFAGYELSMQEFVRDNLFLDQYRNVHDDWNWAKRKQVELLKRIWDVLENEPFAYFEIETEAMDRGKQKHYGFLYVRKKYSLYKFLNDVSINDMNYYLEIIRDSQVSVRMSERDRERFFFKEELA